MLINLKFDFDHSIIFIPDGYVADYRKLQIDFIEWCQDQEEAIICRPGWKPAYQYSAEMFLRYINEVVLCDCNERAYITRNQHRGKLHTLFF